MGTNVLISDASTATAEKNDLRDIVSHFSDELPRSQWLTKLNLTSPRRNLTCLPLATVVFKRAADLVIATSLLLVTAPILLLTAIMVKMTSRGPIIYAQTRVGLNLREKSKEDRRKFDALPSGLDDRRNSANDRREASNYGRLFTMYKFRTMKIDAEAGGAQFAQKADPRVTLIGRFLRRTRIDELPQLWNVIRGDMSMVGPRPERPQFMETLSEEIPNYVDRLGLKPGLTGMAQVVNGYDNEIEGFRRKVSYDLMYLQNCCILNDLKILLRTVRVVLTGEGAL